MKYCFVGVGSIAKKHIGNIRKLDKDSVIHAFRSGKSQYSSLGEILDREIFKFEDLDSSYDVVFITNPTSMHFDTLDQFKDKSESFFIEKPVFSHFVKEDLLALFKNKKTYVAAPLRFSAGIQYASKIVSIKGKPLCIRSISSSYLPDWRPGVDYRNTYSAHAEMGGGVHIDLIHELDYVVSLLGEPKKSFYINKQLSSLEIDSYDVSSSIHMFDKSIAEIHLDYFGRDKKRICELYFNDETYVIDLINNKVLISNGGSETELFLEQQDMYLNEMKYFLNFVKDKSTKSINDIFLANRVLKIIESGE